jgi:hypothetical protein
MGGWQSGERDPLVAFLNDRMPARQIFGKMYSEPHSQSTSRKRTPADPEDDTHVDEPSAKRFDGRHTASDGNQHPSSNGDLRTMPGLLPGPPGLSPVSTPHQPMSTGMVVSDMATGNGTGTGTGADMTGLMDVNTQPFEDLLDDVGYFHSIFPSA